MTNPFESLIGGDQLKSLYRERLIKVLDSIRGKKLLILDPQLSGPLSFVVDYSFLKERGVDKVYFLTNDIELSDDSCKELLFLTQPTVLATNLVADKVIQLSQNAIKPNFYLYLSPNKSELCWDVLENRGVLGSLTTVGYFEMDLIPIAEDVLTLQHDDTFKDMFEFGDFSSLSFISNFLMKMQIDHGYFNRIVGKGDYSKKLSEMLTRQRLEQESLQPNLKLSNQLSTLIILDRTTDLITPLLTPLTYEGLLHHHFGIVNNSISYKLNSSSVNNKINLNGELYKNLKDCNFAKVGKELNKEAKIIDKLYKERHDADSVGEINKFVKSLPQLQERHKVLKSHTELAELILKYTQTDDFNVNLETEQQLLNSDLPMTQYLDPILKMISNQEDLINILRLICLQSQLSNGLPIKMYQRYTQDILQTFGYHNLITLTSLKNSGLIQINTTNNNINYNFNQLRQQLLLIIDDVDELDGKDIAYTYSGYAPLSIRLIQLFLNLNINNNINNVNNNDNRLLNKLFYKEKKEVKSNLLIKYQSTLQLINGKLFDLKIKKEKEFNNKDIRIDDDTIVNNNKNTSKKLVVIVFLGGITYPEISALRYLNNQPGSDQFLIVTTNILTGNQLIKQHLQPPNPNLI